MSIVRYKQLRDQNVMDRILSVFEQAAAAHAVPLEDIASKRKTGRIVAARRDCILQLRQIQIDGEPMSTPTIGELLGLDHSTIVGYLHERHKDATGVDARRSGQA